MNTELLRNAILLQLHAASRERGLPLATIHQGCALAGHALGLDELRTELAYLTDKGLARVSTAELSAGSQRWHLSAAGTDYLERNALV